MNETIATFLDGGRVFACLVVALLFWRLGTRSRDRLYHAFAVAFVLFAVSTTTGALFSPASDLNAVVYLPRLIGFCTIIGAIIDKNRRANATPRRRKPTSSSPAPSSSSSSSSPGGTASHSI